MYKENEPYIHGGVDLCHRLIISGKLVDLHSITDQFTGDFDFELGQFTLGDGIWLGNDWNNVDLRLGKKTGEIISRLTQREGAAHTLQYAAKYGAASIW